MGACTSTRNNKCLENVDIDTSDTLNVADIIKMDRHQLQEWLSTKSGDDYKKMANIFFKNKINGTSFIGMTDEQLKNMSIKIGDRLCVHQITERLISQTATHTFTNINKINIISPKRRHKTKKKLPLPQHDLSPVYEQKGNKQYIAVSRMNDDNHADDEFEFEDENLDDLFNHTNYNPVNDNDNDPLPSHSDTDNDQILPFNNNNSNSNSSNSNSSDVPPKVLTLGRTTFTNHFNNNDDDDDDNITESDDDSPPPDDDSDDDDDGIIDLTNSKSISLTQTASISTHSWRAEQAFQPIPLNLHNAVPALIARHSTASRVRLSSRHASQHTSQDKLYEMQQRKYDKEKDTLMTRSVQVAIDENKTQITDYFNHNFDKDNYSDLEPTDDTSQSQSYPEYFQNLFNKHDRCLFMLENTKYALIKRYIYDNRDNINVIAPHSIPYAIINLILRFFDNTLIKFNITASELISKSACGQHKLNQTIYRFNVDYNNKIELRPTLKLRQNELCVSLKCEYLPIKISKLIMLLHIVCINDSGQKLSESKGICRYENMYNDNDKDTRKLQLENCCLRMSVGDINDIDSTLRFKVIPTVLNVEYDEMNNYTYFNIPIYNINHFYNQNIHYSWYLKKKIRKMISLDVINKYKIFYSDNFCNEYWCLVIYKKKDIHNCVIIQLNLLRLPLNIISIDCECKINFIINNNVIYNKYITVHFDYEYNNTFKWKINDNKLKHLKSLLKNYKNEQAYIDININIINIKKTLNNNNSNFSAF